MAQTRPAQRPPSAFDPALNRHFLIGLARAYAGAILFALSMLMTMEMWRLGFYISDTRLALLIVVTLPLLVGLSHYIGFEETFELKQDLVDALVAYAVGFSSSAVILLLLSIIDLSMSPDEIIGKVAIQAAPAAIGALLAQGQLGQQQDENKDTHDIGYAGTLFLMAVGAVFLALNVAPTEGMILIAYRMSIGHTLVLLAVSVAIMHAFVYTVQFRGAAQMPENAPPWRVFLRYTVVGYALVLLLCLFVLWIFGRTGGLAFHEVMTITIVLGFPASIGAAAARLIL